MMVDVEYNFERVGEDSGIANVILEKYTQDISTTKARVRLVRTKGRSG